MRKDRWFGEVVRFEEAIGSAVSSKGTLLRNIQPIPDKTLRITGIILAARVMIQKPREVGVPSVPGPAQWSEAVSKVAQCGELREDGAEFTCDGLTRVFIKGWESVEKGGSREALFDDVCDNPVATFAGFRENSEDPWDADGCMFGNKGGSLRFNRRDVVPVADNERYTILLDSLDLPGDKEVARVITAIV